MSWLSRISSIFTPPTNSPTPNFNQQNNQRQSSSFDELLYRNDLWSEWNALSLETRTNQFNEIYQILSKACSQQQVRYLTSTNDLNFVKFFGLNGLRSNYEKLETSFFNLGNNSAERIILTLLFLPSKVQIHFFDRLTVFLGESITHVQFCQTNLIMERCIDYLSLYQELNTPFDVVSRLSLIIGTLGSFSVNAAQVTNLLRLIVSGQQFNSKKTPRMHMKAELSALILGILARMTQVSNPSSFFNFDGQKSGISILEPSEKFSLPNNGFTFFTWIRLETSSNSNFIRLFSVYDKKNGIELLLKGNQIWVRIYVNGKRELVSFGNQYLPIHRWTMISLSHPKSSFFSKCELYLYINEMKYVCEIKKFPNLSTGVTLAHIGTKSPSLDGSTLQAFKGQMGSISLFQQCLSETDVNSIYEMGVDFQFQFKPVDLREFQKEIGIAPQFSNPELLHKNITMLYIPRAAASNSSMLVDNSIKGGTNAYTSCSVYISKPLSDTLQCVGGVEILFPLFQSLTEDDLPLEGVCVSILGLIYKCLQNSLSCQQDVARRKSLATLGFLMTKVHRKHLTIATLKQFFAFSKVFKSSQDNYKSLFLDIILNFKIWSQAEFAVQFELLKCLSEEVDNYPNFFKDTIGIQHLIDISHKYMGFCGQSEQELFEFSNRRSSTLSLSDEELLHILTQMHNLMKQILQIGNLDKKDVKPYFLYLLECKDKKQLCTTLRWLPQVFDEILKFVPLMIELSFPAIFKCLSSPSKSIRILFIKFISSLLEHASKEKRIQLSEKGYFFVLFEYIQEIDDSTYCALLEMLLLQTSSMISEDIKVKERHIIALEGLLDALLISIPKSNINLANRFIDDITTLISNKKNAEIILKIPLWYNKLIQLGALTSRENDIVNIISQIICKNFVNRNSHTHLYDAMVYIKIYCVERSHNENLQVLLLEGMMDNVAMELLKEDSKDHPIWENFFYFCQLVEEVAIYNLSLQLQDRVNIAFKFIKSIDDIVRKCIVTKEVMEGIHFPYIKKKSFTLRNIFDVAQEVTGLSQKGVSHLEPTIFVSLFKLHLFLLEELDKEILKKEDQIIRMLGLCCIDIQDPQVPEPKYSLSDIGIDPDVTHQRMYYLIAHSFRSIDRGHNQVINFVRPVLMKYKDSLSNTLTNLEARQTLSRLLNTSYLKRKEKKSLFKKIYDNEWRIIKKSGPLSIALEEADKDIITSMSTYQDKSSKIYELALREALENNQRIDSTIRNLVKEISEVFSNLTWKEKQRFESWESSIRRKQTFIGNNWNETLKDFYYGVGVWKLHNLPQFEKLDLIESYIDRQRPRIILNPEGTSHQNASQYLFAENKLQKELEIPDTPIPDTSIFNFNAVNIEIKGENENNSEIDTDLLEDEYVIVENTEETNLKRNSYESPLSVFDVELILPLLSIRGKLEVTRSNMYFSIVDEFEDNPPKSEWNNFEKQWPLKYIEKIYRRRYLLSHTAVELFMIDRTTVYFNFVVNRQNELFVSQLLRLQLPNLTFNGFPYTPQQLFKKSSMTEKWRRREISNFEYLMHLNTIANRTYNDLTQYFVMPWVINDYTSETIDLNDASVYRDLSKPIGALNPSRLEEVIERYESFSDPVIPSFHYGSHYSSCGTVLYYLIRVEPFTDQNIKLQGGTFDLADRLFHSVATSWHVVNVSTSDVKELVPEFFYLPEMFKNNNKLFLGVRQDGVELGDVVLPPWAPTAEEFVRIQREALESEFVSKNLHQWIDLIFGWKQRGAAAVKAYNVFYYLTYEGSIDLSKIEDNMVKKSIITQLKNFGQTPSQLLTKPHPERYPMQVFSRPTYWMEPNLTFNPYFTFKMGDDQNISVLHISYISNGKIIVVDENRKLQIFQHMKPKALTVLASSIGVSHAKDIELHSRLFVCLKDRWIISCGHFDRSIKCTSLFEKKEVKQCHYNHKDIVTCMAACEFGTHIVTGSLDCTVRIWKANPNSSLHPLKMHCVIYGHDNSICSVDVNNNFDLVASVSTNGKCLLHRLFNGKFIRKILLPERSPIHLVRVAPNGNLLLFSRKDRSLFSYNQNGVKLAWAQLDEDIYDLKVDPSNNYVFTGGSRGQVVVRNFTDLMELKRYTVLGSSIMTIEIRKVSHQAVEVMAGCSGQQVCFFSWYAKEAM